MNIVKTTFKGQIVIPSEIRKKYRITKGTRVMVFDNSGEIVIKPLIKTRSEKVEAGSKVVHRL